MNTFNIKNTEDILALTPMQEGMLFHYLKDPGSEYYFEQLCLDISGKIDVKLFEKAWNVVIETNEMLRTAFRWEKVDHPLQIVLKQHKLRPLYHDLSALDFSRKKERIEEIKAKDRENTFDLRRVPFRVTLCKVTEDRYEMIISNHHILYDGWSNGIILKEFTAVYNELFCNKTVRKPVKSKFKEFIKWLHSRDEEDRENFWREYLKGFSEPRELPVKIKGIRTKEEEKGCWGNLRISFNRDACKRLEGFVYRHKITMAALLYGAWGILLQRYTDSGDVIFGTTVSGRSAGIKGIENMVGLFINTLPLRITSGSGETPTGMLKGIRDMLRIRGPYESSSLAKIVEYSELSRNESFFDSLLVIENYPLEDYLRQQRETNEWVIESYSAVEITHYDLTLGINLSEEMDVIFIYNKERFAEEVIRRLSGHFANILKEIPGNPGGELHRLEMLPQEEKRQILIDFNRTAGGYPVDKTICQLFAWQVERTPDGTALSGQRNIYITYDLLNKKSLQVAGYLLKQGVKKEELVGIKVHRSIEMIAGILGILQAGCGYVPLNPKAPETRNKFIKEECRAAITLTDNLLREIDVPAHISPVPPDPSGLAYVIFTSGSTGVPKGVPITHSNLSPLLHWGYEQMGIDSSDRAVQNLSYYFDWSVWEIFITLTSGAGLVTVTGEVWLNPERYVDFMNKHKITVLHITPTQYQALVSVGRRLASMKHLCIGAEKLTYDLVERSYALVDEDCRIYNMYGPTEAAIMAAVLEIDRSKERFYKKLSSAPIGGPIADTYLSILDRNLNLCPVRVCGELYIGGDGLAGGYLNQPELTSEKFLTAKTREETRIKKGTVKKKQKSLSSNDVTSVAKKLYKTGDRARWLEDGTIEFLGRKDHQVKVRGFRIELGEIENCLLTHEGVKAAVVITRRNHRGEPYLCAYIRGAAGSKELKEFLSRRLPDYMIPSYFVFIDKVPLNPNGKVDIKALPDPEIGEGKGYIPPQNDRERELVEIWSDVLEIEKEKIGIGDNFFELGGHSLKAALLTARIHKRLEIEIPLVELFTTPTIRELSLFMWERERNLYFPVEPVEEKEYYVLSSAQKRLYFLQQMDRSSTVYNVPSLWETEGAIDRNKLESTFRELIRRHESLRTSFKIVNEEAVQVIHDHVEFEIEYSRGEPLCSPLHVGEISNHFVKGFDLSQAPLLRVGLIEVGKERHILMVDMHHIVSDGMSAAVLIQEFTVFYAGGGLPETRLRYRDYAEWQNREARSAVFLEKEEYWKKEFTGEIPVLELPTDYSRSSLQSFEGSSVNFEIDKECTGALNALALESGTTRYMVLLALYTILLSKVSNGEEVVVGTPMAGRSHADLEGIIGMFVNTLPLRSFPAGGKTFLEFLAEIKKITLSAFENQEYQYEDLVEQVVVNRDLSRNPLFDVVLSLQNMALRELKIPGLKLTPLEHKISTSKFDLTLEAAGVEEKLWFRFEYSTKLFERETIDRFIAYFKNIVSNVLAGTDKKISQLEIISREEKKRILTDFNGNRSNYPGEKTIHRLFEEQAERTPEDIALVGMVQGSGRNLHLTYGLLNKKSGQIACLLRRKGVKPDTLVGIMLEPSVEMVIGILGILKSGSAYLPIDVDYPQERIDYMLADSGAGMLLKKSGIRNPKNVPVVLNFDLLNFEFASNFECRASDLSSSKLCYIMYTSGSTGRPKGVLVEHRSVIRLVMDTDYIELTGETRILQTGAPVFDATTFEIWGALLNGGGLVLVDKEVILDAHRLGRAIEKNKIDTLWLTSPLFNQLAREDSGIFSSLNYLLVGGDVLSCEYINLVRRRCKTLKIINGYGPTENTTFSTTFSIDREFEGAVPIGRPICNSTAFVLDAYGRLQPVGIYGELWVGGDGVSRGYLNSPDLTGRKFVEELFPGGGRLYRTGDIVRWLPDGNIEFSGRIDHQVKIRGFRIEPGEIENYLLKHDKISDVVVTTRGDEHKDKYLCAYIVPDEELSIPELRSYLSREFPVYMVPSYFMFIDRIPLNPNGKVDIKALPEPEIGDGKGYIPPRNETERSLVKIWSEVLEIDKEKIGIDDNFFELGGHSLKAALLTARIHKQLGTEIPLVELFTSPTIRELSLFMSAREKSEFSPIEPVEEKEYDVLSSAQKRLYFLQQMDVSSTVYNMPVIWETEGAIDKNKLEHTFRELIRRHESLRTSFEMVDEEPVQVIHDHVEFEIEYSRGEPLCSPLQVEEISKHFVRPFDLSQAPLLRVGLIEVEEEKHILMIDMHHIISDGMSAGILAQDFMALYAGKELPPMRIRYRDYARWQNGEKKRARLLKQGEFWQKEFQGEIPVLELPTDYSRPLLQSFAGSAVSFEIGKERTGALNALALESGTTLYMVLLSLYAILLSKVCSQEDIVVGTPVAGRSHADLAGTMGMFVNTLPLRNYPTGEKTFLEFLMEVKEKALTAFENQEYQYEDLVERVVETRDLSRNPLFDVLFVLQNMDVSELAIPGPKLAPYEYETVTSKFDLTLDGREVEENLWFRFEYGTKLFKRQTIERFIIYFKNIVSVVLEDRDRKLSEIEIITGEERQRLLYDFNGTAAGYPRGKGIHRLFAEQAERAPERTAVIDKGNEAGGMEVTTYGLLNEKSDRLARRLRENGVDIDCIVGIITWRSLGMMVGILAILKAGGAYLPIDPGYPRERQEYILKDSGAGLVLTREALKEITVPGCQTLRMEDPALYDCGKIDLKNGGKNGGLAYVIYTSGSTGRPKGVLVQHTSVVNVLTALYRMYPFSQRDTYLLKTSFMFDVSVSEVFGWFLGGGRLAVLEPGAEKDPRKILDWIEVVGISHINFVPSMFGAFLEVLDARDIAKLTGLKYIFLAGEVLSSFLVNKFRGLNTAIVLDNIYGPTEGTIYASRYPLSLWKGMGNIPIGKPLQNITIYILSKQNRLHPIGVAGELCIGGMGLALGYLNRPGLTGEKFITGPFVRGERLYRTGDLARWLPDGNIDFLGRIDHQVKIRGFRIELEEIESRLLSHGGVKEAAVVAGEDQRGDKYLCAYVVDYPEPEKAPGDLELKEYLARSLPGYMVPSFIMKIETMPLTSTGKIDRRALPAPLISAGKKAAAPGTEIEKKLAEMWRDLLPGVSIGIGIDDNFFRLGGHSLIAIALEANIRRVFNVKVPLTEIFKRPTLRGMARYIKNAVKEYHRPVEAIEKKEYDSLSSAQKRLYFLQQMDGTATVYNMPAIWETEGAIDRNRLESTFIKLIRRHESLRTSFKMVDEEPVQVIHEHVAFELEYGKGEPLCSPSQAGEISKNFVRSFDLSQAPLLRVGLIRVEEEKHILMIDMHHIISDGMSAGILVRDFMALYAGNELPLMRIRYRDYARWQNLENENVRLLKQGEFWQKEFQEETPVLELPLDYSRPLLQSFAGSAVSFEIDKERTGALKALALESGTTLYMVLLSLYAILLSKVCSQEDIVVGTPVAGRSHADLEEVMGMFVNMLPLRNYPVGEKTFLEFLTEVKEKTLTAFENQEYQYEDLVERAVETRDLSRNPLFDAAFVLQNMDVSELVIPGLKLLPYESETVTSKFDLTLEGAEGEDELRFRIEYGTKLFKRQTIERFILYFKNIVSVVLEGRDRKLSQIEVISGEERQRLLYDFNAPAGGYPTGKTIPQLFVEQVERTPDCTAVCGQRNLYVTYDLLNKKSLHVAGYLLVQGVKKKEPVGITVKRSIEMIVGILGILQAGCGYVPLNPGAPESRNKFILDECRAAITLTGHLLREIPFHPVQAKPAYPEPFDPAYIIFTSGSTGMPKGVPITHSNLSPLLHWGYEKMGIDSADRAVQNLSYYFDWSVWEIFITLTSGAGLVMVSEEVWLNADRYVDFINRHKITVLHITPTQYRSLVSVGRKLESLKHLCIGAEKLAYDLVARSYELVDESCRVYNMYGPTEATIMAAVLDIHRSKKDFYKELTSVPIGGPIANTYLQILDGHLNLCPFRVCGELYIGGEGLAVGYLNQPELTNEKFLIINRGHMYKTGDRARWLEDGTIEFLGRRDHQVKVRGFRIELGEIENRLLAREDVKAAVVITRRDHRGEAYLCGYVQGAAGMKDLRGFLSRTLPDYMIPSYFVCMDKIPLTANGKADIKALPEPEAAGGTGYMPPRHERERALVEIWSDLLKIEKEKIGIDDNFFELGGHSLNAAMLTARIHKRLGMEIPLVELFTSPSVRELALYMTEREESRYSPIEPVEEREYYVLSSAQKRLYFLQIVDEAATTYNIPSLWEMEGAIDKNRLEKALNGLIRRHEGLRTSFKMVEKDAVQVIHDHVEFEVEYSRDEPLCSPSQAKEISNNFVRSFDLSQAPQLRVGLMEVEEEKHILMVDMHHIISDGISAGILAQDFMALYAGKELPLMRIRYRDYARWQNKEKESAGLLKQREFWQKQFPVEIPVLDLPTDFTRPSLQRFEGSSVSFETDEEHTRALKALALGSGATLYMVLLALFLITLSKVSNREDIVIGTPVAGRSHADLEKIIGMFVNTLPLRNYPAGEKKVLQFLAEVKENTLNAFENREYPFEELVEMLEVKRDPGRNPLFDVSFALQNMEREELELSRLKLKPFDYEAGAAKFDLTLLGIEIGEKLFFTIQYKTKLFKPETIRRLSAYLIRIVKGICRDPGIRTADLDILTEKEKQGILVELNHGTTRYAEEKTIDGMFAHQVERTPGNIALVGIGERTGEPVQLTYRQLNKQADGLADVLKEKGVGSDTIVGIMVDVSLQMVVSILGVLKAGGAYLPIDPDYPRERIDYMLSDSGARIVVKGDDCQVESVVGNRLACSGDLAPRSSELAYVIYTSGTTGNPKGVLVEHRNIAGLMETGKSLFHYDSRDAWTMFHSYCFDFSVWEMYGALLYGGKLVLIPRMKARDPRAFLKILKRERVTILNQTPTVFYQLVDEETQMASKDLKLRCVIFGGEALKPGKLKSWKEKYPETRLVNMYGITETTVHVTFKEITSREIALSISNIGKPLASLWVCILNKHSKLQPVGVAGELCVGGQGVARGYLNRPELTAEKFLAAGGYRIYRSGDLVRLLENGEMEYLGRIDHQVKIRGNRVETGEIERQMLLLEELTEALVIARTDEKGDNYLCAYMTFAPGVQDREVTVPELREALLKRLPEYMIPSYFIPLEEFPVTSTGKLDREKLPLPGGLRPRLRADYAAPQTETSRSIARVWKEILNVDRVGIHDNFFDLGGTSLDIVRLSSRLNEVLTIEAPIVTLFEHSTIHAFTRYLEDARGSVSGSHPGEEKTSHFIDRLEKGRGKMKGRRQKVR